MSIAEPIPETLDTGLGAQIYADDRQAHGQVAIMDAGFSVREIVDIDVPLGPSQP